MPGLFFHLAGGVFLKFRVTDGKSVTLFLFVEILKSQTGGARPARRLTFVQTATKVSKNAFLLAEGIILLPVFSDFFQQ